MLARRAHEELLAVAERLKPIRPETLPRVSPFIEAPRIMRHALLHAQRAWEGAARRHREQFLKLLKELATSLLLVFFHAEDDPEGLLRLRGQLALVVQELSRAHRNDAAAAVTLAEAKSLLR